ncbi:MAG: DUF4922 domain-containing protein, partial [Bacteroidia bacterium]|nr:DUF4922 domain-containing protein [Bacteroidia bacterium]
CLENLPAEQKGILFQNKYLILANPYPIFHQHLTISKTEHHPQEIYPHFADLLNLSRNLPGFTIFYNGPQCGASAPDHFHFQAVKKEELPVEKEFEILENEYAETLFQTKKTKVIAVENYLRRMIAFISDDKNEIRENFEKIYKASGIQNGEEPMMNILCNFENEKWRVIFFPRGKQRPSHFFETGEKQIIVSPATVEMGGILVLPRENDFKKITKNNIAEIYNEVTIDNEKFETLIHSINKF